MAGMLTEGYDGFPTMYADLSKRLSAPLRGSTLLLRCPKVVLPARVRQLLQPGDDDKECGRSAFQERLAGVISWAMPEPDDTELGAEVNDGADHTAVIPDTSETKAAQLAWSMADNFPDVTSTAERQPLPLPLKVLLGCVAIGAVTLVAFVIGHRGFPGSPQHASAPNAAPAVKSPGAATAANSPQPARAETKGSTAQSAAESIRAAIPQVTELIEITEDNDPNNLIGRPNGYVAASVLVDSRLPRCTSTNLGDDCGAIIEQWPDQAAAQRRDDYVQSILRTMPMVGQQWTAVKGNLLLRVTGQLKPSAAEAYKAAFTA
jgi:hypothetical protein